MAIRLTEATPTMETMFQQMLLTNRLLQEANLATQEQLAELRQKVNDAHDTTITTKLPLPEIEFFDAYKDDSSKFDLWLQRFELAVECSAPNIDQTIKVKFLLTKLSVEVYDESSILPQNVKNLDYASTITSLRKMFAS